MTAQDKKPSILDRVRNLMPEVSQLTESVRTELAALRDSIKSRTEQRDALLDVPMTKADYLALMLRNCDTAAVRYANVVAGKITRAQNPERRNHYGDLEEQKPYRGLLRRALNYTAGDDYFTSGVVMEDSTGQRFERTCWLHLEAIKAAITTAMETVEWPFTDSERPLAELLAEHQRLGEEIDTLLREEEELLRLAEANNINVD